ncbi:MAG: sodium:proline symporter [Gammaproteobacteria bacterium]|nr:sodium:proline symporter [Gammaproteobacteria bacterium]MCB1863328.1 sodium:proline symporter [Gammaproteobacteria bacterium]MCB1904502.1 sodium:proline symporter [Gammaproteobacteria bacterium]
MSLILIVGVMVLISFLLSPRTKTADGFFRGFNENGAPPSLWTLVFSQVTTWIFARSLMNAAILGYYYGIAGALAYAAYYLSFLTGGLIIDRIRFEHGQDSIQNFLRDHFGRLGTSSYNIVVAVRLLSEVFANLLVIGVLFGAAGSNAYTFGVIAIAVLTLGYSMMGGLRASLRTDVFQTLVLIAVLLMLLIQTLTADHFSIQAVMASSPDASGPGWVLLAVALLQIWSYPMHDPVMMDRGFLADRTTTWRSFMHAAWISIIGILIFGLLGVHAGLLKSEGEALVATLTRLFGEPTMLLFNAALVISALSTLDSTLSSAAKLSIVDMRLAAPHPNNGRLAMALFLVGGLFFLFLGSKDLFAAVAVSGTASMFLAPVLFFCILGRRRVARWSYALAFFCAMTAGAVYMLEAGGQLTLLEPLFGVSHKYAKLLILCVGVLAAGCTAFALGMRSIALKAGEEMA